MASIRSSAVTIGRLLAGGQQVREIAHRDAQVAHVRHLAVVTDQPGLGRVLDRRERRHVPDHRQRAVFGVEREGDLPVHRHLPDRRALRRLDPVLRHTVGQRHLLDHRVVGVEEDVELGLVEVLLVLDAGRRLDGVGVIEHHAEVADAADAGLRADRRLAALDAGIAEGALLGFAALPVVVDLLVRAAGDAHPPAAALLLVDQHDPVLLALVDRAGGAGGRAARVEAVLAEPRQVHHEGVLELAVDLLLDAFEVVVLAALLELAAEDFLPVRSPLDLLDTLAGDQRAWAGGGKVLHLRGGLQVVVVEGEGLVEVVDLRQVGVAEDVGEDAPLRPLLRLQVAARVALPAAVPALLVLPVLGVADAGLGLDVVEPGVFDAFAAGPDVLAGDRAGVTADALVEVQHLADLRADLHSAASRLGVAGAARGWSSQSTLRILRTMTNSSRLEPTVP